VAPRSGVDVGKAEFVKGVLVKLQVLEIEAVIGHGACFVCQVLMDESKGGTLERSIM